jgi:urea carboxylase system permease
MTSERESRVAAARSSDRNDLATAGYKQELERTLGRFSSFAAGFSYLSILTGMFQFFYVGYGFGGPAFFWTWPAFFLGQFSVALCFAELGAHYPLAGSVYQWSKYAGSWSIGWMAGWIYLASYIITLAAVTLALQITLPQLAPVFQIVGDIHNPADSTRNAVLLGCLLICLTTLINAVGVRWMARINNLGVFTELIGAVLLIVLLALHARRGPEVVLDTQGRGAGLPFGYLGPFFAAALMASYVMYGFDTAGSLAEETTAPRRRVPWSILQALLAAAFLGALLMLFGLMAAPDLEAPELSDQAGGLPFIVTSALGTSRFGEFLGKMFLANVVFAVCVCALAVHAGAVRLIFAMARDNNLPCGAALSRVWGRSHTPVLPTLAAGGLAVLVLIVNLNAPKLIEAIGAVAIVWANLAYLLVTAPLLVRRLRGWPKDLELNGVTFRLGRWGLWVNLLAVVWGVATVVNIGWPRPEIYGDVWYQQYAALLFTTLLVASGGTYYGLVQRHMTRILEEHRA